MTRRSRWPREVLAAARAERERLAALEGGAPPRPEARQRAPGPKLTKLEARYQAFLEEEHRAGRVVAWKFEPMRLVLRHGGNGQKGMTYCPDFGVLHQRCVTCSATGRVASVSTRGVTYSACAGCDGTTVSKLFGPQLELVEVKPTKKGKPFFQGDSRTKVFSAAELFRGWWPLVLVTPEGSGWRRQVL